MRIAQQLYEGLEIDGENKGLITYMRTDSTRISVDAINMAKDYITQNYGEKYVGKYVVKNSKSNVQDAHEGIRPSDINLVPDEIKGYLTNEQYKLYKLIWDRFLVSQFAAMQYEQMQINAVNKDYRFRGTINKVIFDGYYKIFKDEDEIKTGDFPELKEGSVHPIEKLNIEEGITKPPTRFSEATLVKKLESEGIGRPSTYASIVETLKTREYVEIIEKRFFPTYLGYEVKDELVKNFKDIMNVKFTANMEKDLDKVEEGTVEWVQLLRDFYGSLEKDIVKFEKEIDEINILNATFSAMRKAINQVSGKAKFDVVLVDGNHKIKGYSGKQKEVIKGDAKSLSIAAASIVAKVTRDRMMLEVDKEFPEYGFAKHKGYGTKLHREILLEKGPCKYHRKSFLKKILGDESQDKISEGKNNKETLEKKVDKNRGLKLF